MLAIAVWNYAPPGPGGTSRAYQLSFRNVPAAHRAYIWVVDRDHGSALAAWEAMGEPRFPSLRQQKTLLQAATLPGPRVEALAPADPTLTLQLRSHALALVELAR